MTERPQIGDKIRIIDEGTVLDVDEHGCQLDVGDRQVWRFFHRHGRNFEIIERAGEPARQILEDVFLADGEESGEYTLEQLAQHAVHQVGTLRRALDQSLETGKLLVKKIEELEARES